MKPKISVIVPIYNVEKYLRECLDSIVGQTLQEIEILCMDDGSIDRSAEMIDEYVQRDSRIRVVHKENSGYGDTMNQGMQMATGKYIAIVEPDDYIARDMFEIQYNIAERESVEVLKSDYYIFYGDGEERTIQTQDLIFLPELYDKVVCPKEQQEIYYGYVANWAGIYRRDFIEKYHIRHNTTAGASYQDQGFWFQVMSCAERVYITHDRFYCYRQDNPDSSIASKSKVYCIVEEYEFIYRFLQVHPNIYDAVIGVYGHCKYSNYVYNFQRIAVEYREPFIERFATDFRKMRDAKELKKDAFTANEWEVLQRVMEQPQSIVQSQCEFEKQLQQIADEAEFIVIYGAGMVGKKVYHTIEKEKREKVKAFLVTEADGDEQRIESIPVRQIDCYPLAYEKTTCLIAVTEKYQQEMQRTASKYCFKELRKIQLSLQLG